MVSAPLTLGSSTTFRPLISWIRRKKSFKSTSFKFTEIGSPVYLGELDEAVVTSASGACGADVGPIDPETAALAVSTEPLLSALAPGLGSASAEVTLLSEAGSPNLETGGYALAPFWTAAVLMLVAAEGSANVTMRTWLPLSRVSL